MVPRGAIPFLLNRIIMKNLCLCFFKHEKLDIEKGEDILYQH